MFIDTLFILILIAAIYKGYSKGLIVAVFSFAGIFIGLAAAIKLSATMAVWLQKSTNISGYWLPFLSFTMVMIAAIFLVKIGAKFIEKTVQFALLGWVNKLGGILLFTILYISILSVVLFYFDKMHLLKDETIIASKSYFFIQPIAPKAITIFGELIPIFKNMFHQLETFFEQSAYKINT